MHKDQKRIEEKLIPTLGALINRDDPEAVRDCTVLNRLLLQGADPLYLMETCPGAFEFLCNNLDLSEESGREAILLAHEQGPAVLLCEQGGIPVDPDELTFQAQWGLNEKWRREGLWLLLASFSDCTEEEYNLEMTMLRRIQRATYSAWKFQSLAGSCSPNLPWSALRIIKTFAHRCPITLDERGIPHVTKDEGFYIAYRAGHKVCAYDTPSGLIFYGTVPSTSLDEQGIKVDKKISEQYGLVFGPSKDGVLR